jgi:hypothetical protein
MCSCYDWIVYDHRLCLLTEDNNDNPIITRTHIFLLTEDNDNPIIIRPHIMFTDVRIMIGLSLSSVSKKICVRVMIGLSLLSSVSKHNLWSYYDWVFLVVVRQ